MKNNDSCCTVPAKKPKWRELFPLLLIIFYVALISLCLNIQSFYIECIMISFMGFFFIFFSMFKFLDLKGFSESFTNYDPIANKIKVYAHIYPFLELLIGIGFIAKMATFWCSVATLIIFIPTTLGVTRTLLNKKDIKCACLGTVLRLPMTEATFIENSLMILMALMMII